MTLETYARASRSSSLAWSDFRTGDIDWLTAAALCARMESQLPAHLARLMAGADHAFWPVVECLENSIGRKFRISRQDRRDIQSAVMWWMDRACQSCEGRGQLKAPDAPHLLEKICLHCQGQKIEPHTVSSNVYAEALKRLDVAAGACTGALREKLAPREMA